MWLRAELVASTLPNLFVHDLVQRTQVEDCERSILLNLLQDLSQTKVTAWWCQGPCSAFVNVSCLHRQNLKDQCMKS